MIARVDVVSIFSSRFVDATRHLLVYVLGIWAAAIALSVLGNSMISDTALWPAITRRFMHFWEVFAIVLTPIAYGGGLAEGTDPMSRLAPGTPWRVAGLSAGLALLAWIAIAQLDPRYYYHYLETWRPEVLTHDEWSRGPRTAGTLWTWAADPSAFQNVDGFPYPRPELIRIFWQYLAFPVAAIPLGLTGYYVGILTANQAPMRRWITRWWVLATVLISFSVLNGLGWYLSAFHGYSGFATAWLPISTPIAGLIWASHKTRNMI